MTVSETVGFLTEEGSKHSRTLPDGTFIIANSGATLGVAKLLGVTCCANDGIAAIINQRLGDKPFICFFVNTKTKHLRDVVETGNGQPNLNTGLIRGIAIPFPPPSEQRAIAAALSDVDALLDSLDRLIAKKRNIKQAAMQQLLTGQTRLPGFHGKWEVCILSSKGTFTKGRGIKKDEVVPTGLWRWRATKVDSGASRSSDCIQVPGSSVARSAESRLPRNSLNSEGGSSAQKWQVPVQKWKEARAARIGKMSTTTATGAHTTLVGVKAHGGAFTRR